MDHALPRRTAVFLFAIVVVSWGLNWAVTKVIVHSVVPLWATAIRTAIASVTLLAVQLARREFILPRKGDWPVIMAIALLHMVAFSALVAFGLKFAPVGRSIVLGYTTPLWVVPGAALFLKEPMTRARLAGTALGLLGLVAMFNPLAFDWNDRNALMGSALILLAALCWAANILYVRAHKWISTPFQLTFWQTLLATCVLSTLGLVFDGVPQIAWSPSLAAAFLYAGIFGTALAYWAMAVVNRSLPAATTSLGILATPVIGVVASTLALGETIDISLLVAMVMILSGIAVGTIPPRILHRRATSNEQAMAANVARP
jgi:drug/metabolite transporter (DMT)-like permease